MQRTIDDRLAGQGRFEGCAVITAGHPWTYKEKGEMILPGGQRHAAQRSYLWEPQPERGAIDIYFDDGRPFHTLPLSGGETGHWCDPDQYDVRYDFGDWPQWEAVWTVRGPRKDYTMRSWYRSQSLAPAAK